MGDVPAQTPSPAEQTGQNANSPQYQQSPQSRPNSNQQSNMAQQHSMPFMNMGSLGTALPPFAPQSYPQQSQHSQQQFPSTMSTSAAAYHIAQTAQFPQAMNHSSNPSFNMQYQQYQGYPPQHNMQQSLQAMQQSTSQGQQYYPNPAFISQQQSQSGPQLYFPQGGYAQQQVYPVPPQQYDRSGMPHHSVGHAFRRSSEHLSLATSGSPANRSSSSGTPGSISPSVPRGPPRKPKQSGNALWVGNLPPGANIVDLKDHFSRDATNEIESVFLISKSNCAFVNYKTEAGCLSAMERFHESKFNGARLVCRLRRQSSPAAVAGVPTGPAALTSPQSQPALAKTPVPGTTAQPEINAGTKVNSEGVDSSLVREKYFIVKSLTMEDLESSVRSNIWATQSHNEEALNKAYETADNVYLIFSANKSGEYFGYARMASPINNDPAAAIEFAPKAQTVDDPDQPKAIFTEATATAPKGRIIDDSARGTIFWEADSDTEADGIDGADNENDDEDKSDKEKSDKEDDPESATEESKAWGKPFKLEWISTNRLPFYKTRGLRNPWNSNREVKIARDGTELETSVGRRLVQMFQRNTSPVQGQGPMPGMMMGMGYPQVRFQ